MEDLTPNEVARLHLKARHGTLTPEEQQVYSDYMARQIASAQPPEGGEPPKHGKPKRNVDIPNVLGKIAGIAYSCTPLLVQTLVLGVNIVRTSFRFYSCIPRGENCREFSFTTSPEALCASCSFTATRVIFSENLLIYEPFCVMIIIDEV